MIEQNTGKGIAMMVAACVVFAMQDAVSRYLAESYNVMMVIMFRFWFFGLFVVALAARRAGGLQAAMATRQRGLQVFRGILLAAEVVIMVQAFVLIGLVEAHAVFAVYPLLVAALSGPVLGERVGWRRWTAIGLGFVGVLIILQPGLRVFQPAAILPLIAALMFAVYGLLTRYVSRQDSSAVSFFWTGIGGAGFMTLTGVWFLEPMAPADWGWMGLLCMTAAFSHFLLIRAYELAEASAVQPFSYLQLPFAFAVGVLMFGDVLASHVMFGTLIVVMAGLFTLWRARVKQQQ